MPKTLNLAKMRFGLLCYASIVSELSADSVGSVFCFLNLIRATVIDIRIEVSVIMPGTENAEIL